jgi:hypothetical protein
LILKKSRARRISQYKIIIAILTRLQKVLFLRCLRDLPLIQASQQNNKLEKLNLILKKERFSSIIITEMVKLQPMKRVLSEMISLERLSWEI